jgi:Na+-driven multidrug efflux pump
MQGIKNLTQGPINRQLFNLAMPIMATSFIQMAYSLTDMAWVGRLGSEAVAAIGSVGILTWMSGSISLLNKVGSECRTIHRCAKPGRCPQFRIS